MSAGALLIRQRAAVVFFGLFFPAAMTSREKRARKRNRWGSAARAPRKHIIITYLINTRRTGTPLYIYVTPLLLRANRRAAAARCIPPRVRPECIFLFSSIYASEGLRFFLSFSIGRVLSHEWLFIPLGMFP